MPKRNRGTCPVNPLRAQAIALGLLKRGSRNISELPVERFQNICRPLQNLPRPGRRVSHEAARIIANSVLLSKPINATTFICVSDYVGGVRYKQQNRNFALTYGEETMFRQLGVLREACDRNNVVLDWRLILADSWGLDLYPDRLIPGGIDAYCAFMAEQCRARGFQAIRWTTLMAEQCRAYEAALEEAQKHITDQMVRWEASVGEIAHDKITDRAKVTDLARRHIEMRAAEGAVLVGCYGPQLVLSTESRSLQRYDNLVVPRSDYPGHDWMPKYPHRLDQK